MFETRALDSVCVYVRATALYCLLFSLHHVRSGAAQIEALLPVCLLLSCQGLLHTFGMVAFA